MAMAAFMAGAGGAAGSGIMDIAGNLLSGFMNKDSAHDAMHQQRRMYQHRYRWMMSDMEKAGLNPMLAYSQGGGGVPSGITSSFPNVMSGAAATARDYYEREKTAAEAGASRSRSARDWVESKVLAEEEQNRKAARDVLIAQLSKMRADQDASVASARQLNAEASLREAQLPGERAMSDFYKQFPAMRVIEKFIPSAGALGDIMGKFGTPKRGGGITINNAPRR